MTELVQELRAPSLEDWLALPETLERIEFIEGALVHMPRPSMRHQRIAVKLLLLLEASNPDREALCVVPEVDVLVGRDGLQPDVIVAPMTDTRPVAGEDLQLAVEIESPSSLGNDRLMKPNALARAGVPSYWRIEPDPLVVHVYELSGESLVEIVAATGDDLVSVRRPWPLSFRVRDLEP